VKNAALLGVALHGDRGRAALDLPFAAPAPPLRRGAQLARKKKKRSESAVEALSLRRRGGRVVVVVDLSSASLAAPMCFACSSKTLPSRTPFCSRSVPA
jgi:hypothetical protein